jgi:hypothetical protein
MQIRVALLYNENVHVRHSLCDLRWSRGLEELVEGRSEWSSGRRGQGSQHLSGHQVHLKDGQRLILDEVFFSRAFINDRRQTDVKTYSWRSVWQSYVRRSLEDLEYHIHSVGYIFIVVLVCCDVMFKSGIIYLRALVQIHLVFIDIFIYCT